MRLLSRAAGGLAAAALSVSAAVSALAQPAEHDAAKVEPGRYAVEPAHTQVEFSVFHMGFTPYYGRLSDASGTLVLSPATPADSKLDVTIPADTISTTSSKLNDELKGDQWFDVQRYPQITFHSTSVEPSGDASATVVGDLTMHGVTRPVTLSVQFVGAGTNPLDSKYTVGFRATGQVSRSAFGVQTYVPLIGDAVEITLSGAFEKQG